MTAHSRFRELIQVDALAGDASLLLGGWEKDEPFFRDAPMHRNLASEFGRMVIDFLREKREHRELHELELRSYDPGHSPDPHDVLWMAADHENENLNTMLSAIPAELEAPPFSDEEGLRSMSFFVVGSEDVDGHPILCFRALTPAKKLTRGILASFLGNRFTRVEQASLVFEPGFQVILYREFLFIFSKKGFERLFRYYQEAKARASVSLDAIDRVVPIMNLEQFKERVARNVLMARRLLVISQSPALGDLSMSRLKETIRDFGLGITVSRQDGREVLVYDDATAYEVIKLLEDQFVDSPTTGRSYEANSKREVRRTRSH